MADGMRVVLTGVCVVATCVICVFYYRSAKASNAQVLEMRKNPFTTEYYEQLACKIMQHYYPKKFDELKKSESPDFYNSSVGFEVTRAISKEEREILGIFNTYMNRSFNDIPEKLLKKLELPSKPIQMGGRGLFLQRSNSYGTLIYERNKSTNELILRNYISTFADDSSLISAIIESIINKTRKLNENYKNYPENDLIIVISEQLNYIGMQSEMIEDFLTKFSEHYKNNISSQHFDVNYNFIYLLFMDNLFIVTPEPFSIDKKNIPKEVYENASLCASKS